MCKILIFGGTTEGRLLAEFCMDKEIPAVVSVVSGYGRELLKESPFIKVRTSPMDGKAMETYLKTGGFELAVDATHPYAVEVTENIRQACEAAKVRRIRCLRETPGQSAALSENSSLDVKKVYVSSPEEAVSFLENRPGRVLVTTGSKELAAFSGLENFKERVYARVLPSVEAIEKAAELGIEKSHLIGMQGPFSEEMNTALIRQVKAEYLVTKETGAAGGFEEKLRAAGRCGITAVILTHPKEKEGCSLKETCAALAEFAGKKCGRGVSEKMLFISLAGIGPGAVSQMTGAVIDAVRDSSVLFGAPRVLQAVKPLLSEKQITVEQYQAAEVAGWLKEHAAFQGKAAILFSGDAGFYSGAKKMINMLQEEGLSYEVLPGISSVSYFAAKLGASWEDAALCTAHGRNFDPAAALKRGEKKIFVLLGGENGAGNLCRELCENGFSGVRIAVGEMLSYPEERVVTGTAEELIHLKSKALSLMLIENGEVEE